MKPQSPSQLSGQLPRQSAGLSSEDSSGSPPAASSGTFPAPRAVGASLRPRTAEDEAFDAQLALAENANLKERLARLEGSIAFWAADVDEAAAEVARVRTELDEAKRQLRGAEDKGAAQEDERAALIEAIEARDSHIAALEARVTEFDLREIDDRRTRSRLEALRARVRARMIAQAEEIEGLRRTVALGHAARRQVEDELRAARSDAARNARYLDRVEERLREAGEKLAGTSRHPAADTPKAPSATMAECKVNEEQ